MITPMALAHDATALLQRLIRFNTVNPPGNERPAQEMLRGELEAAGFECELLGATEERPNLIARLRGASDGPRLCYLSHVDTVLADPAEWTRRPLVRRVARRPRVGARRARHEGPGRVRGRRGVRARRARVGARRAASCS